MTALPARAAIPIAFDVLGTCFSFAPAVEALVAAFPERKLEREHARAVVEDWFHSSQRDFTYLSMNGSYTPIAALLRANLPRTLYMSSLLAPPSFPSAALSAADEERVAPVLGALGRLDPRPGLREASALLFALSAAKDEGGPVFKPLAATNGGLESTRKLFALALGEEEASRWGYFSCDEAQVAKPDRRVYEAVWRRAAEVGASGAEEGKERRGWFVASHVWDLHAARLAGFQTAFVAYEEHLSLADVWGAPDVVARDLEEAVRRIVELELERER
ncbi:hypothetical protein JCM10207_002480 [Rhodosporidiobolus poonsookiae]